ncbi:MAG: RES domain-containing protein [Betaproteobacteria bacterium]|nr:RES domain-containing protein [Betaproteobacteria bacterium]
MNSLFSKLTLADVHQDVARNIVSLRASQDLFDDLTEDPAEWSLAQKVEDEVKPPPYRSRTPVIDRPFEDAEWFNAITWPFKHWQASRFSDGTYGVWYGSDSVETTVYESVGFDRQVVIAERKVYQVACAAALLDFRAASTEYSDLLNPVDYSLCQSVGARIHREGHPGLLTPSVRRPAGENVVIFNPDVLSNPRLNCQLTYRVEGDQIVIEEQPGVAWITLAVASFS